MKIPRAETVILEEAQREKTTFPDLATRPITGAFREVLLKTFPHVLVVQLLEAFASSDVTSDKIADVAEGQAALTGVLHKKLLSLSARETLPSMAATIVLLGMEQSRNLLMESLMGFPLNYAKIAERDCALEGGASTAWIFGAGLVYDKLSQVITDKDVLPAQFAQGIKLARVAQKLAMQSGERNLVGTISAAALLSDVGKLYLSAADPKYLAFQKSATNNQLPRAVRLQIERSTWQFDHATAGAVACETFRFPRSIGLAIQFHHFPKLAQARDPGAHRMAQILSLATRMVRSPKRIVDAADPIVDTWFGPELAGTTLTRKIVVDASTIL